MVDASLGRVLIYGPQLDRAAGDVLATRMEVVDGSDLTPEQAAEVLGGADAVYVTTRQLSADLIRSGPNLRVVGTVGSGTNRIDVDAATEAGIPVINGAGAAYHSVAEHAIGFMISLQKRIARYDRWLHEEKRFPSAAELHQFGTPGELQGKTVGVVGLGYIGKDIAEKARLAFGMQIRGYDPFIPKFEAARQGITLYRNLDAMIPDCDFLVVAAPLNESTRGMIGAAQLRRMKPTGFVVVVSRGGIVDELALIDALQEGTVAGAAVDVFDPEPAQPDNPLFRLDQVIATPHIAGGTREAYQNLAVAVTRQMIEAMDGERPDNVVNPSAWGPYVRRWFDREE